MEINSIERHLFLEGIFLRYGYDFRQYSEASLNRRLKSLLLRFKVDSLIDILKQIIHSPVLFYEILPLLTINTTEFFRDPSVFFSLRNNVFPILKTYSSFNVWIAGCSSGEEVISLAIALKENQLLDKATIYATDINPQIIKKAKTGIYEISSLQSFNKNYVKSGGTLSPSEYYTADYDLVRFDPELLESVVFSEHNLATDAPFIEAQLILCRNVLIYFNKQLQNRIFKLFADTLAFKGVLTIGSKESIRFSSHSSFFEPVDEIQNIFYLKSKKIDRIN
jgi:chemotaxis protein methyltransferase CheR